MGSNSGFSEIDAANFSGSFYSVTKAHTETFLRTYTNALVIAPADARIR